MASKKKFSPTLQMKFREPFRNSICPWNGPNSVLNLEEMDCVDVEIRGQGRGVLNVGTVSCHPGTEVEYMDIRVYLAEKKTEGT